MTRRPLRTATREAAEHAASKAAGRKAAAAHVREWWDRRKRMPGYADSTSPNTKYEFEALIQDLEQE